MKLFKTIIFESVPFITNIADVNIAEAVDFCFELYNRIITLAAKDEERIKVIKIGLKSFFDGLGVRGEGVRTNSQDRLAS